MYGLIPKQTVSTVILLPMVPLLFAIFQLHFVAVKAAIGLDLQLGYTPRGMYRGGQTHQFSLRKSNEVSLEETFSEIQEESHSSKADSHDLQTPPVFEDEEQHERRPVTIGLIVSNVGHLSEHTLILRLTLNEFHRWEIRTFSSSAARNGEPERSNFTAGLCGSQSKACRHPIQSRLVSFRNRMLLARILIETGQALIELPCLPEGTHYIAAACFLPGFVTATGRSTIP
jgi:hypothetical protein